MSNLFFRYLDHRLQTNDLKEKPKSKIISSGPLITISRQAGCSARDIAKLFYKNINRNVRTTEGRWKCIDKEIIFRSARRLELEPRQIKYVFNSKKKSTMDEIVSSLAHRYYKSDKTIRNTIIEVIKDYAQKGNTIMVGRAGVALSQHVKKSFNIRLMAPLEWRIEQIAKKHGVDEIAAADYIQEMDMQRTALIEEFYGRKMDDSMFDIIFNCKFFNNEEIVKASMEMMKKKNIII